MPLVPIKLRPGVNTVETPTLNEGGFSASQNVRFFEGIPQKDGGFVEFANVSAVGTPRALRAWTALSGVSYLGIAGTTGLYVVVSGMSHNLSSSPTTVLVPISVSVTVGSQLFTINDALNSPSASKYLQIRDPISVGGVILGGNVGAAYLIQSVNPGVSYTILGPAAATANVVNGGVCRVVTATSGNPNVNILLPSHGLTTGQIAIFNNPLAVGGIVLSGNYLAMVIDANNYTVFGDTPTSTQTVTENGGDISITFNDPLAGWGDYDAAQAQADTFGEFLLATPWGGPLFVWMPASGLTGNPAAIVATAPQSINVMFVASQQQMVIVGGTIDRFTSMFDPMLVRFSDVSDYTNWTPTATDQAGSFRLSIGSAIRAGMALPGQNLLWTDIALYSMQYIQFPLVWGFQPLGVNCGADGPHAVGILAGIVYWKNRNQFWVLSPNGPEVLPCPVWDDVFLNQDLANLSNVVCEANSFFGEISWSVPQKDRSFVQARLKIGLNEPPQWTVGPYHHHVAWIDQNVFGAPIGGHEDGLIDQHETGSDGFGAALPTSLTTGRIKIAEGDQVTQIRGLFPDIKWLSPGTLTMTASFYDDPNKAPRTTIPYTITPETDFIGLRGRGRDVSFTLQGNDTGSNWRLGLFRYYGQADGKR